MPISPLFTKFTCEEIICIKFTSIKTPLNLDEIIRNTNISIIFFHHQTNTLLGFRKIIKLKCVKLHFLHIHIFHEEINTCYIKTYLVAVILKNNHIFNNLLTRVALFYIFGNLFDALIEDSWVLPFSLLQPILTV